MLPSMVYIFLDLNYYDLFFQQSKSQSTNLQYLCRIVPYIKPNWLPFCQQDKNKSTKYKRLYFFSLWWILLNSTSPH